jgi:hypothetical protein
MCSNVTISFLTNRGGNHSITLLVFTTMSFTFAALKALRSCLGMSSVSLCGHVVQTDATQIHPDLEPLVQCSCNVVIKSLVASKPLKCECPKSFSSAMGTNDIKVHVVLLYGIQRGEWTPKHVPSFQMMLHEQLQKENGGLEDPDVKALIFYGKTDRPSKVFKSQVYLGAPRVSAETVRLDIERQLSK